MPADRPSLTDLLHQPVRWRIAQALIGRRLTTADLAERLPDVPHTTLYRHVGVLVKAEVLRVVGERKVRGTVERTYELAMPEPETDRISPDQLRTMFTVYLAGITGDMDRYLERDDVDPMRDGIAFRQAALRVTDAEYAEFQQRLGDLIADFADRDPGEGRTRRILSTILMPE
ncbi:helix-turn-helix domain-containing protein [Allokutzneria sp. NRRL B-24872]|uniref:helix-turn-helix domain-containing protein n=1 Tax=Allokutzneria sp. NRRL B-24872 TaxID=1137961 RepID=UPI001FEF462C|nr:helix-turn-helix domain-containing protein [Allokutzneria sp. NRRL B-24872]